MNGGTVERLIAEAITQERQRLARILVDHGHVALAVCVETYDDGGFGPERCRCGERTGSGAPCPGCLDCRGTGERQPTVQP